MTQPTIWSGTIELSWPDPDAAEALRPAFTNVTAWTSSPEEFRKKCVYMGVIGFSHAGFNKQFDVAIVSTPFVRGDLCGSGHRYFLKKVGGQWKVVSKRMTWET